MGSSCTNYIDKIPNTWYFNYLFVTHLSNIIYHHWYPCHQIVCFIKITFHHLDYISLVIHLKKTRQATWLDSTELMKFNRGWLFTCNRFSACCRKTLIDVSIYMNGYHNESLHDYIVYRVRSFRCKFTQLLRKRKILDLTESALQCI
jgi:hypothetical protein